MKLSIITTTLGGGIPPNSTMYCDNGFYLTSERVCEMN